MFKSPLRSLFILSQPYEVKYFSFVCEGAEALRKLSGPQDAGLLCASVTVLSLPACLETVSYLLPRYPSILIWKMKLGF